MISYIFLPLALVKGLSGIIFHLFLGFFLQVVCFLDLPLLLATRSHEGSCLAEVVTIRGSCIKCPSKPPTATQPKETRQRLPEDFRSGFVCSVFVKSWTFLKGVLEVVWILKQIQVTVPRSLVGEPSKRKLLGKHPRNRNFPPFSRIYSG